MYFKYIFKEKIFFLILLITSLLTHSCKTRNRQKLHYITNNQEGISKNANNYNTDNDSNNFERDFSKNQQRFLLIGFKDISELHEEGLHLGPHTPRTEAGPPPPPPPLPVVKSEPGAVVKSEPGGSPVPPPPLPPGKVPSIPNWKKSQETPPKTELPKPIRTDSEGKIIAQIYEDFAEARARHMYQVDTIEDIRFFQNEDELFGAVPISVLDSKQGLKTPRVALAEDNELHAYIGQSFKTNTGIAVTIIDVQNGIAVLKARWGGKLTERGTISYQGKVELLHYEAGRAPIDWRKGYEISHGDYGRIIDMGDGRIAKVQTSPKAGEVFGEIKNGRLAGELGVGPKIFDAWRDGDDLVIFMEKIEGYDGKKAKTVKEAIEDIYNDKIIDPDVKNMQIEEILSSLLLKIDDAVRGGLMHGDLHLSNAMIRGPNNIVLIDWGNSYLESSAKRMENFDLLYKSLRERLTENKVSPNTPNINPELRENIGKIFDKVYTQVRSKITASQVN